MGQWRCILVASQITFGLSWSQIAASVVHPRLSSISIRVNQEEREIQRGEKLEVLRGDLLTLRFAKLENSSRGPDIINLMGYRQDDVKTRFGDDRDILIDTNQLRKEWSLNKKGQEYKIEAKSKGHLHGFVRLVVTEPKLLKIDLQINDEVRSLAPGDKLELKVSDTIQVKAISANHELVDREAKVVFEEKGIKNGQRHIELQLWYRKFSFASVNLYLNQN